MAATAVFRRHEGVIQGDPQEILAVGFRRRAVSQQVEPAHETASSIPHDNDRLEKWSELRTQPIMIRPPVQGQAFAKPLGGLLFIG